MLARKEASTTPDSQKPQLRVMTPSLAANREQPQSDSYRTASPVDTLHPLGDIERVAVLSLN